MANTDLVKKKPVALEVATYERLSKLAAQLRIDNPGGRFVSMSAAVERLLNLWDEKTIEPKGMTLLELLEATKKLEGLDEVEIAALDAVIFGYENK